MNEIRQVNVEDVLRARDNRAARQKRLLEKYKSPLVSFTMNIAGSVKRDEAIERAFLEGFGRIKDQICRMGGNVLDCERTFEYTGCEALWAVVCDAKILKEKMILIEEADDLGRLFDIDVIDENGVHLSRDQERKCLICGGPVRACARSRAHTADALFEKAHDIIDTYFRTKFCRQIGELAQWSLLREALTTPKPGLVDRENNGAHRDMDLFSFADSACALRGYFEDCARIGMEGADFSRLQYAGQRAECAMFAAAKANTHMGAIFSVGILCCAVGFCGWTIELAPILKKASELGKCALKQMENADSAKTGGETQYRAYGLTGARGEAASGFKSVTEIALPAMEKAISEGKNPNDAGLCALLALMANVYDSNIIRRAGMDAQEWVMERAKHLLENGFDHDDLRRLNTTFVERNISPGGSADLLAVAYFLHKIKRGGL